ncbi:uncharacterized protein LOC124939572 [Impatiens glandulifera]|uniref:uncharacterized protein LOC124939572 n=1 Tax=Impatiens glandulifera TaxID=253017 RepID=UPI001FB085D4|nr:uncharacterized protein LOC124939572 [Impatiens glandulifera]
MNFNHHHHPMEPPSNQSFYGTSTNDYTSFWPEEDNRIVGMKRPYPFSMDNPTGPSFRIRYPPPPPPPPPLNLTQPLPLMSLPLHLPPFAASITRSEESAALPNLDSSNLVFRDRHSSAFQDIRKQMQASRVDNGDFLSLAPPSTTNHTRDTPPEIEYLPCQGGGGEEMGSRQRQPFYSFFPSAKAPSDDPSGSMHEGGGSSSSSGGGGGGAEKKHVDLNLKL